MKSLHLALAAWTALAASGDASAFTAPGAASPPGPASSSSSSSSSSFSSGARPGKVPAAPAPLGMALKNREDRRTSAADKSWGEIFGQAAEVTEVFAKVAGDLAVEALEATRSEEEKKPGGGGGGGAAFDVSVPYDAAARLAYDEWLGRFDKGDFDPDRYPIFRGNYERVAVQNVTTKKKAREGAAEEEGEGAEVVPDIAELKEYADLSEEEYKELMKSMEPVTWGGILGKAVTVAATAAGTAAGRLQASAVPAPKPAPPKKAPLSLLGGGKKPAPPKKAPVRVASVFGSKPKPKASRSPFGKAAAKPPPPRRPAAKPKPKAPTFGKPAAQKVTTPIWASLRTAAKAKAAPPKKKAQPARARVTSAQVKVKPAPSKSMFGNNGAKKTGGFFGGGGRASSAGAKKLSPKSQRLQTTFDKKAQAQRDAASKKLREKKMREAAERRRRNAEFLARQKSGRA